MAIVNHPTPFIKGRNLTWYIYLISKLPFLYLYILYNPYKVTQYDHLKPTVKYQFKMSHGAFMTSMPHEQWTKRPGFLGYFSGIILHRYMEIKSYTMKSGSSHETTRISWKVWVCFFRGSHHQESSESHDPLPMHFAHPLAAVHDFDSVAKHWKWRPAVGFSAPRPSTETYIYMFRSTPHPGFQSQIKVYGDWTLLTIEESWWWRLHPGWGVVPTYVAKWYPKKAR